MAHAKRGDACVLPERESAALRRCVARNGPDWGAVSGFGTARALIRAREAMSHAFVVAASVTGRLASTRVACGACRGVALSVEVGGHPCRALAIVCPRPPEHRLYPDTHTSNARRLPAPAFRADAAVQLISIS